MTNPILCLLGFLAIALIGWAVAEIKNRTIHFVHSEEEAEGYEEMKEAFEANGERELTLRDLLKKSCTTGFKSI